MSKNLLNILKSSTEQVIEKSFWETQPFTVCYSDYQEASDFDYSYGIGVEIYFDDGVGLPLYYRRNMEDGWTEYPMTDGYGEILCFYNPDEYIQFCCMSSESQLQQYFENAYSGYHFVLHGGNMVSFKGNMQSLLNYSDTCYKYCFTNLFGQDMFLQAIDQLYLPAQNLQECCYSQMFYQCCELKYSVKCLPAKEINSSYCYGDMFGWCTILNTVPKIQVQFINQDAYGTFTYMFESCQFLSDASNIQIKPQYLPSDSCSFMFQDCYNLVYGPKILSTELAWFACGSMFFNCIYLSVMQNMKFCHLEEESCRDMFNSASSLQSIQVFDTQKEIIDYLAPYCCAFMFNNSGLIKTPSMKNLSGMGDYAFENMFSYCLNLTTVTDFPQKDQYVYNYVYKNCFSECENLVNVPPLTPRVCYEGCYEGMFQYCTSLQSIAILGEELYDNCFGLILSGCNSLSYVKVAFTDWTMATDIAQFYISDNIPEIKQNGTFVKPSALPTQFGSGRIPQGWTVQNY